MKNINNMKNKALVIIAGTKGGTGKSLTATLIYSWLKEKGTRIAAFDGDNENSTLCRFIPEAAFVDMRQPNAIDQILGPITADTADVVLLDSRAGTSDEMLDWLQSIGIEAIKQELGCQITIVATVTAVMDTLEQLRRWSEMLQGTVRWLVVRNTVAGATDQYDASKLRRKITEEYRGREVTLPKLPDFLMQALDKASLTIHAASKSKTLDFVNRSRCAVILKPTTEQLASVAEVILP
jgi:MinD-like ATPase involved in chromosome partitioning or flagellar assembly